MGVLRLTIGLILFAIQSVHAAEDTFVCPSSLSGWDKWMGELAENASPYQFGNSTRSVNLRNNVDERLLKVKQCREEWEKKHSSESFEQVKACSERNVRFLESSKQFRTSDEEKKKGISRSLGFNVPDQEYYKLADKFVGIPEELKDQKFIQEVSHPLKEGAISRALAHIETLNEKRREDKKEEIVAFYFPTLLGNFEGSQKRDAWRLFVKWPGNPVKYIQFATHEYNGGSGQTSVVAVHTDEKGVPNAYIKDHWRDIPSEGPVTFPHITEGIFKGNACINCHQSGPRQLNPAYTSGLDEGTKKKIASINQEIGGLSGVKWGGFYDAELSARGPGLGELVPGHERSNAFFEACTKKRFADAKQYGNSEEETERVWKNRVEVYQKLRGAMNCTQCHDGSNRGPLRLPFDTSHTLMKIYKGEMPPDNNLTSFERSLLAACLEAEFFGYSMEEDGKEKENLGTLKGYLLGIRCEKPTEVINSAHPVSAPTHEQDNITNERMTPK